MVIWGKIIGAALGFTFYGSAGFVLGLVFGHIFDNGLGSVLNTQGHTAQVRLVFFRTVFQTMGCIAKADGVVSEAEIRVARDIMLNDFHLTQAQMLAAIRFFNEGKQPDFDLDSALKKFRTVCVQKPALRQYFLEMMVKAASADQVLWPAMLSKLQHICRKLNVPLNQLDYLLRIYNFSAYSKKSGSKKRTYSNTTQTSTPLSEAYNLLGVSAKDDMRTIKKAYRRLMSKYHPDKLVAKGLPNEMLTVAKEKAQKITAAYDLVERSRK